VINEAAKKAFNAAQKFTATADSFVQLAANPFSPQQVKQAKDMLVQGFGEFAKSMGNWAKVAGDVAGELGKGLDEQIKAWGDSIREHAELDKQASLADDQKREQLKKQFGA
jgi:hypothetical protein